MCAKQVRAPAAVVVPQRALGPALLEPCLEVTCSLERDVHYFISATCVCLQHVLMHAALVHGVTECRVSLCGDQVARQHGHNCVYLCYLFFVTFSTASCPAAILALFPWRMDARRRAVREPCVLACLLSCGKALLPAFAHCTWTAIDGRLSVCKREALGIACCIAC